MRHQEGPDLLGLVGRESVHDDVHLAPSGLRLGNGLQEAAEFRARATSAVWPTTSPVRVLSAAGVSTVGFEPR